MRGFAGSLEVPPVVGWCRKCRSRTTIYESFYRYPIYR